MPDITISRILVLIALVIFVLAAFGVSLGTLNMIALGLAVYMASNLLL